MPAPFYFAIKGTTSGTPGSGAFTPSAAASGYRAWSNVPTGWMGLVRFEDGSAWELGYSYWNGTTLSRGTNQRFDSSTGSALSLTSSATAAMVVDPREVLQPDVGNWRALVPAVGATSNPDGFRHFGGGFDINSQLPIDPASHSVHQRHDGECSSRHSSERYDGILFNDRRVGRIRL
jgi:hypothetical protein